MHEVEINSIAPLSSGEQSLLDMHSVLNVLNVLRCELSVLGLMVADDEEYLKEGLDVCHALVASLTDHEAGLQAARSIDAFEAVVFAELKEKVPADGPNFSAHDVSETIANLGSVFAILKVRAREILARAAEPERWQEFDCDAIRSDFGAVFAALEKNSKGRWRILYNAARQEPNDYYVDLRIDTEGPTLSMPPVFKDVMRDLIANARKYTAPGGRITAAFYEDHDAIRFVVEDTGRGIQESELQQVVEFGKRGSNVSDVRTMGGGFGLTKAFLVTKQFGGRFWIASEIGVGTRIRIKIPRPADATRRSDTAVGMAGVVRDR
ncbi:MAG: histidine kinase [Planctomycetes bacterium]|nr:histidine kinase [Planctomycetota bacterium]